MTVYENEPSSVPLRDAVDVEEFLNFALSLGFYAVCGMIGLLPKNVRYRLMGTFVGWSAKVDERRYQ
ncbi:serine/threonine protein phosphatase [Nocardia sp. NPDC046763]|uniref:serine/threonine protein phosphatase n=1 Tax=Nocardia sp. NPDC046763 TaxID=3155256 RepID=UPI0033F28BE9